MKNIILITMILIGFVASSNAQSVPLVYSQTMEWAKVPDSSKKILLTYANAGKYDSKSQIAADSLQEAILITGIKSRSGKIENQVWLKVHEGGGIANYLCALSELPNMELDPATGKLTIGIHRGDTKTDEQALISRGPYSLN